MKLVHQRQRYLRAGHHEARKRKNAQAGSVMVMCALTGGVLLGFMALAMDLGYLQFRRRVMQTAADSGAVAGAQELRRSSGLATSAALADAATNGFANGVDGVSVTVNQPPASGRYAGDPKFIEVNISQNQLTFFAKIMNFNSALVRTRAVAGLASSPNCIYVLDRSATGALTVSGNSTVNAQCGIVVDSSSPTALTAGGSSCLTATSISITGGYTAGDCFVAPTPLTGVPPETDPLAYLPAPGVGPCDYNNYTFSGLATTLNPGVYCGGIKLSGPAIVTFRPGIYILNGGGLSISGITVVSGTGVMFYNTFGVGQSYGPISISGTATVQLSAPTSGAYEGILFFTDRNAPSGTENSLLGTVGSRYEGALYFPSEPLRYAGDSLLTTTYTAIVSRTLTITGNSKVQADYSSLDPNGSPIKRPTLAE